MISGAAVLLFVLLWCNAFALHWLPSIFLFCFVFGSSNTSRLYFVFLICIVLILLGEWLLIFMSVITFEHLCDYLFKYFCIILFLFSFGDFSYTYEVVWTSSTSMSCSDLPLLLFIFFLSYFIVGNFSSLIEFTDFFFSSVKSTMSCWRHSYFYCVSFLWFHLFLIIFICLKLPNFSCMLSNLFIRIFSTLIRNTLNFPSDCSNICFII